MTIVQTNSLVKKLERKSAVKRDINMKIKHLQKRLVTLTFMKGDHTAEYFAVLGEINELRSQIFKDASYV
jgi:hypothetical protein